MPVEFGFKERTLDDVDSVSELPLFYLSTEQLQSGPVDVDAYAAEASVAKPAAASGGGLAELRERVDRLEAEIAGLKEQLGITPQD